jgi:hypothetical protein
MFKTISNGGKLSQLNNLVAVYELEQDNDGNYTSKIWEWFTKEELTIIGNLCETMKHWRRHNPEVRFSDSLYG